MPFFTRNPPPGRPQLTPSSDAFQGIRAEGEEDSPRSIAGRKRSGPSVLIYRFRTGNCEADGAASTRRMLPEKITVSGSGDPRGIDRKTRAKVDPGVFFIHECRTMPGRCPWCRALHSPAGLIWQTVNVQIRGRSSRPGWVRLGREPGERVKN